MIRINQLKIKNDGYNAVSNDELLCILLERASKALRTDKEKISRIEIVRHSVDARKKPEIYDVYMVDVSLKDGSDEKIAKKCRDSNISVVRPENYRFPFTHTNSFTADYLRPVIVGAGPAGLFCGYMLAQNGYKPIILERGADVDKRGKIVEHFWNTGELDEQTNVQFGEGGAGTFSDGKLNTMVRDKDKRGREVLKIFVENGAPEDILYEAKPHIGTDILRAVVKSMREKIISWGGEVRFETCVTDIDINDKSEAVGVTVKKTGGSAGEIIYEKIKCSALILAIGHSARDTFYMLKDRKVDLKPKPFAVGLRVEHPQTLINMSQYGIAEPKSLPPAPYKLTTTTSTGRGVYSFCMCPGGYVVNASSEEGRLAVNGMSYSKRDGKNANSAIIVTVDPKDFGGDDVLSGVEFQRNLEKKAYNAGGGKIPVEYYGDFKEFAMASKADGKANNEDKETHDSAASKRSLPCTKGDYVFADVHNILPKELNTAFVEGMEKFGRMIKGYDSDDALVSGVESRTSSPVRINRAKNGESVNVKWLYPCGEGAGYAGGIMSAAMDGMKISEHVAESLLAKEKSKIRHDALGKRNAMSDDERLIKSRKIFENVAALSEYKNAENILVYASMKSEVITDDIILDCLATGKNVFCPKCTDTENGVMEFVRIKSLEDLKTGYFGIREPELTDKSHVFGRNSAGIDYNKTLMLMPTVAFDAEGNRIGYGGGYYDRFLERFPKLAAIAVAFKTQLTDVHIPCGPYDVRPVRIITEEAVR